MKCWGFFLEGWLIDVQSRGVSKDTFENVPAFPKIVYKPRHF